MKSLMGTSYCLIRQPERCFQKIPAVFRVVVCGRFFMHGREHQVNWDFVASKDTAIDSLPVLSFSGEGLIPGGSFCQLATC